MKVIFLDFNGIVDTYEDKINLYKDRKNGLTIPKLVSKLIKGFNAIKEWLIKIATPAAAVAVRYRCIYEKI